MSGQPTLKRLENECMNMDAVFRGWRFRANQRAQSLRSFTNAQGAGHDPNILIACEGPANVVLRSCVSLSSSTSSHRRRDASSSYELAIQLETRLNERKGLMMSPTTDRARARLGDGPDCLGFRLLGWVVWYLPSELPMTLRLALIIFLSQLIMGSGWIGGGGCPSSCGQDGPSIAMEGIWQANYSLSTTARVTIEGEEYEAFIGPEDGNEFEVVHEGTTLRFAVVCDDPVICTTEVLGTEFYVNPSDSLYVRHNENQFGIGLPSPECLSERHADLDECVAWRGEFPSRSAGDCAEMVCEEVSLTNYDQPIKVTSDNTFDYRFTDPRPRSLGPSPLVAPPTQDVCGLADVHLFGEVTPEGEGSIREVNDLSATIQLLYPAGCFVEGERTPEIERLLRWATVELSQSLTAVRVQTDIRP